MQVTINVPDGSEMATEIASWQDGAAYEFNATQTAPNVFDATYVGMAEEAEEAEVEPEPPAPSPMHKNPAIAKAMSKGMK